MFLGRAITGLQNTTCRAESRIKPAADTPRCKCQPCPGSTLYLKPSLTQNLLKHTWVGTWYCAAAESESARSQLLAGCPERSCCLEIFNIITMLRATLTARTFFRQHRQRAGSLKKAALPQRHTRLKRSTPADRFIPQCPAALTIVALPSAAQERQSCRLRSPCDCGQARWWPRQPSQHPGSGHARDAGDPPITHELCRAWSRRRCVQQSLANAAPIAPQRRPSLGGASLRYVH